VDTDGVRAVYAATLPGSLTGSDVFWTEAGVESRLERPGEEYNPAISAGVIAFECRAAPAAYSDVCLYEIATNRLFQLTDTPFNETLADVAVLPGGLVRVVWQVNDGPDPRLSAIRSATFALPPPPAPLDAGVAPCQEDDDEAEGAGEEDRGPAQDGGVAHHPRDRDGGDHARCAPPAGLPAPPSDAGAEPPETHAADAGSLADRGLVGPGTEGAGGGAPTERGHPGGCSAADGALLGPALALGLLRGRRRAR
jgi:hypothetical protein